MSLHLAWFYLSIVVGVKVTNRDSKPEDTFKTIWFHLIFCAYVGRIESQHAAIKSTHTGTYTCL